MPKRVEVTREQFAAFEAEMINLGFSRISPEEVARDRERLGLVSRRHARRKGREVGFSYPWLGFRVKVWTSWDEETGQFVTNDQGWALITKGDRRIYVHHPFNRTKKFLRRLCNHAEILQELLHQRPKCQHCKTYMELVRGYKLKEYGWACQNINNHPEQTYETRPFDAALSPKAVAYLACDERKTRKYRERREEEGKPNYVAMLRRKGFAITRPENIE